MTRPFYMSAFILSEVSKKADCEPDTWSNRGAIRVDLRNKIFDLTLPDLIPFSFNLWKLVTLVSLTALYIVRAA